MPRGRPRKFKEATVSEAIIHNKGDKIELSTPYNREFVAKIKADIPVGSRAWNAESKRWIVDKKYIIIVEEMLNEFYDSVSIEMV